MTCYGAARPLLFALDAERAHRITFAAAGLAARVPGGLALLRAASHADTPALATQVCGLRFANPVGLAAGFDKDGTLVAPLAALGFGFLEVGTVTPRPQPGNPRPRLFRLPEDRAAINRMGFNNAGAVALAARLAALGNPQAALPPAPTGPPQPPAAAQQRPVPIGVNLGKNKDTPLERAAEDYVLALRGVHAVADYVVVNVSSPNTPGLRQLQQAGELAGILRAVLAEGRALAAASGRRVPLWVKVAPDLDPGDLEAAAQASLEAGVEGIVATNTTLRRDGLQSAARAEAGGLSGRPLRPLALATVRRLAALVRGRVPLVGVGGIASGADAYAFVRAGASLVQLYTGLVYGGPGLVREIKRDLARLLERDGFRTVAEAVGSETRPEEAGCR